MTPSQGRHLFLVGTGRCGSSIAYTSLAMHPDFAWISSWLTVAPTFPVVSIANRLWDLPGMDRWRDVRFANKPVEPNLVVRRWDPEFFTEDASDAALGSAQRILPELLGRICRAHGRPRFLGKIVGRPVKIETLARVFPQATFVHVVRPPKPSIASLLQVEFYDARALEQWPWRPVPPHYLEFYRRRGQAREIAAAIVVKTNMLELERQLARVPRTRWIELGYGAFVQDPVGWVRQVGTVADFAVDDRLADRLRRRPVYAGADDKWRKYFSAAEIKNLEDFEALPEPAA